MFVTNKRYNVDQSIDILCLINIHDRIILRLVKHTHSHTYITEVDEDHTNPFIPGKWDKYHYNLAPQPTLVIGERKLQR